MCLESVVIRVRTRFDSDHIAADRGGVHDDPFRDDGLRVHVLMEIRRVLPEGRQVRDLRGFAVDLAAQLSSSVIPTVFAVSSTSGTTRA